MSRQPWPERFWSKVQKTDSCWIWTAHTAYGYGTVWVNEQRRADRAHRVAYEMLVGPIPEGLDLDHLCRNRACVNPAHLEPVTNRTNVLRGTGPTAANAAKTHCKRGHPFTPENTYTSRRGRECRRCKAAWMLAYYRRRAAATSALSAEEKL